MSKFRIIILGSVSLFALILGAIFAFPVPRMESVAVKFDGASILAEVAKDPPSRAAGLSGRNYLSEFGGMLFLFDAPGRHGIWMKGMKFPLDIIWIRGGVVADIAENALAPGENASDASLPVFTPDVAGDSVLEVNAGFVRRFNIKIGDRAVLETGSAASAISFAYGSAQGPESSSVPIAGSEYFIETLRKNAIRGKDFKIDRLLSKNSVYRKVGVSYKSGDLKISGIMNIPTGKVPPGGFPILILNHGLIHPSVYFSGRGSKREQDLFARKGYVTIHPDYRGLADSSPNSYKHHDFYVGYSEDVAALVDAIKILKSPLLDASRIGMWGHSMGGGIAARVMVLRPEVRAFVLFAPISADAEDNFYELSKKEVEWLHKTYGDEGSEVYRKISPLEYFSDVSAPVQLHHGTSDTDVPIEFSEKMYEALKSFDKKAEFFKYPGEAHEFGDAWLLAAERSLQFFDKYVKSAR